MAIPLPNMQQDIAAHQDEILKAYRRTEVLSICLFIAVMFLLSVVVFSFSLLLKDRDLDSLLLSTAVSLFVSLVFTIFYTLVVDRAQSRSDSRAQSLEIEEVKREVSQVILASTGDLSARIESRIKKMLEDEVTRLVDTWPELLPKDYFPPSNDDPRFTKTLGEAMEAAQNYMFRGATGRFVPQLLKEHGKPDLNCRILLLDPRAKSAIQIYAMNRYADRRGSKPLNEYEADIQQEIFKAIVNLFDLRQHFSIEVRICSDHLFYRSELVDDGAFVSFYVGDRKTLHPPAYFYTRTKGKFYHAAFHKDFQQSWDFSKEPFPMKIDMHQDELEKFLVKLGAGDASTIAEKISEWRKQSTEQV
jgi:hypothetical protein